tara:strand:+ start:366 stop:650 length:285 start_codon:yes stop_codon:yes gene_type:complete
MMGHKAILHIFSTHNNVLITATDLTGAETICKVSGGMVTKGGSDSGGQFASTRAAERIAEMLSEKEFDQVIVSIAVLVEIVHIAPRVLLLQSVL